MTSMIEPGEALIDSRDVEERLAELEELAGEDEELFGDMEREELAFLRELADGGRDALSDWPHGETLIHERAFEDYARDFAEDCYGEELRGSTWPFYHIDWHQAAEDLKMDYYPITTSVGTYWGRC